MSLREKLVSCHRRIVDPDCRGPLLALARTVLAPLGGLYGMVTSFRNAAYGRGWIDQFHADVPVISVGNITAGGTGKTPFTIRLASMLLDKGRRPAVLSRGYGGGEDSGVDDENDLIRDALPGVPLIINPDRCQGARRATTRHGADVLVMDDGFQHRRLARDLDIVLLDALQPFGGGSLLPRGLLREPLSGLERADILVLTRSDKVDRERLDKIKKRVELRIGEKPVLEARHQPVRLVRTTPDGEEALDLKPLKEGRWAGVCAIGNPRAFRLTLRELGVDLVSFDAFPDHHHYTRNDAEELRARARGAGACGIVGTAKDAKKLAPLWPSDSSVPFHYLAIELRLSSGADLLSNRIDAVLNAPSEPHRR